MFRNFGSGIKVFDESINIMHVIKTKITAEEFKSFNKKSMQLLFKHCANHLTTIRLHQMSLHADDKPCFPMVTDFFWKSDTQEVKTIVSIEKWFPQVKSIRIGNYVCRGEHVAVKQLKNVTEAILRDHWTNTFIGKFIKLNPQIEKIDLFYSNSTNCHVLEHIQKLKQVEVVRVSFTRNGPQDPAIDFSRLKNLERFDLKEGLGSISKSAFIMRQIANAKISLKSLTIDIVLFGKFDGDEVFKEILRIDSLESLEIGFSLNRKTVVQGIYDHLPNLCELSVRRVKGMYTGDIMQIVQAKKNLQWLHVHNCYKLEPSIVAKIKKIVINRNNNTKFELILNASGEEMKSLDVDPSEWHPTSNVFTLGDKIMKTLDWTFTTCSHGKTNNQCDQKHTDICQFPIRYQFKELRENVVKYCRLHGEKPMEQMDKNDKLDFKYDIL